MQLTSKFDPNKLTTTTTIQIGQYLYVPIQLGLALLALIDKL